MWNRDTNCHLETKTGWLKPAAGALILAALIGCLQASFETAPPPAQGGGPGGPTGPHICDPFGGGAISPKHGLIGDIWSIADGRPGEAFGSVNMFFDPGQGAVKSRSPLFLNALDVPTRLFQRGFTVSNGDMLKNDAGQELLEKFALDMKSSIVLDGADLEGPKQLAIISDDGAILDLNYNGSNIQINNDGVHPSRMACHNQPLNFQKGKKYPMRLRYYQGPRYHISLVLMWRPNTDGAADPECGKGENVYFWNPNVAESHPNFRQKIVELETRGWRPLRPQNYILEGALNPCAP